MKGLRWITFGAALAFVAAPASAQNNVRLQMDSAGHTVFGGVYVGPYFAHQVGAPGQPEMDVFCVDYNHEISLGQQWNANFSVLNGDLSKTRFKNLTWYSEAAWLDMQFATTSKNQWGLLHYAIWNITSPGTPNLGGLSSGDRNTVLGYINAAQHNYGQVNLAYWDVVTDVNTVNGQYGVQEYLTQVTPEPGTIILLGTGLLLIGGVAVKRNIA